MINQISLLKKTNAILVHKVASGGGGGVGEEGQDNQVLQ